MANCGGCGEVIVCSECGKSASVRVLWAKDTMALYFCHPCVRAAVRAARLSRDGGVQEVFKRLGELLEMMPDGLVTYRIRGATE